MTKSEFFKKILMLHLLRLINYERKRKRNDLELQEKFRNLRRASIVALLAINYFKKNSELFVGKSEKHVAKKIKFFCLKRGYWQGFPLLVGSGINTCNIHSRPSKRIIRENDIIMIDIGLKRAAHYFSDYCSDLTRTFFIGDPTGYQKKVYKIVQEAHDIAIKKVRIGTHGHSLHESIRVFIKSNGHDLPHGLGHSTRRYTHAAPFLSSYDRNSILKEGDHVTIEPGIYVSKNDPNLPTGHPPFGVRIEDLIVVKKDGYACLTSNKKVKLA